jgi:hypothetical protein
MQINDMVVDADADGNAVGNIHSPLDHYMHFHLLQN